jgi:hypothetical protein
MPPGTSLTKTNITHELEPWYPALADLNALRDPEFCPQQDVVDPCNGGQYFNLSGASGLK